MKRQSNISIFEGLHAARAPLAEQMRPHSWDEFCGFSRLPIGLSQQLRSGSGKVPSLILWGSPGCGKTTFARLVGKSYDCRFVELSAVLCGVADIRQAASDASAQEKQTIVFLDEIHRLNKGQQDALLPHVEKGTFALIGATTENPSFSLIKALLSRCHLIVLDSLNKDDLIKLANSAAARLDLVLSEDELQMICKAAQSDGRRLCNLIEMYAQNPKREAEGHGVVALESFLKQYHILSYDRGGEDHYNIVSAFIKSLRGSDADAALYWCFRMLEAGEDPAFILRRMIVFASEDIGNADPRALPLAISCAEAFDRIGLPEGRIPISQCVVFLATAPKSNRSYLALGAALDAVKREPSAAVPVQLRNAPTELMKNLGYGQDYQYPHDFEAGYAPNLSYMPTELSGEIFYTPTENGYEKTIAERIRFRNSLSNKNKT